MPRNKSRFVTACQQMLALGLILAALTPAANVMSLDLVPRSPGTPATSQSGQPGTAGQAPAAMAAYARATERASEVPTEVVDPTVAEYALSAPAGARIAPEAMAVRSRATTAQGASRLLSEPQRVRGYGAVGVTWGHGQVVDDDAIAVEVRTRQDRAWSDWMAIGYHDDHGPDPDSEEGRRARPGTDAMLVGDVTKVQVRVSTVDAAPADLKLAVIDPGAPTATAMERPAIDTAALDGPTEQESADSGTRPLDAVLQAETGAGTGDSIALARASYTPKPVIYSRAQWGANENMRDKGSLRYFEVHAGFVHHTVNANNYQAGDVPAIIRGIYAYHTQSQGWSDVGYNYLVDRFGRVWEGRAGGVDRPVVGAHTLGYNDDSFAMSAIGNYETAQPSQATVQAFGALMAWKLSLHGVDASSTRQYVTSRTFQAINGHRDAGSTACPGRYLYAKIPEIRRLAEQAQVGFGGRQLESNLAGARQPDLVVRRASDKRAVILPIAPNRAGYKIGKPKVTAIDLSGVNRVLNAGDWDRDGFSDVITRNVKNGNLYLRTGLGDGTFDPVKKLATGFGGVKLLAAVGDMTGDGWPDLMGQPDGSSMRIYPGLGLDGLGASYTAYSGVQATRQIPVGLWDADGAPDSLFRSPGRLSLYPGNGPGGLTGARAVTTNLDLSGYDWLVGISDVDLVGHPDVVLRSKGTGRLWLVEATAAGFGRPQLLGTGAQAYDMVG